MIIYQTWHGEDMAESDAFWPTLAQARAHLRATYSAQGPMVLDGDGCWESEAGGEGFDIHIARHDVKPTREGICLALTSIPNR